MVLHSLISCEGIKKSEGKQKKARSMRNPEGKMFKVYGVGRNLLSINYKLSQTHSPTESFGYFSVREYLLRTEMTPYSPVTWKQSKNIKYLQSDISFFEPNLTRNLNSSLYLAYFPP